jgi:uroporphyrinogen decarboxylase
VNKRDAVLSLLDDSQPTPYVPAAFFLHFPPEYHAGQAAVDKHLDYFRYTGMDFIKIQYETSFPHLPEIQTPADWAKVPRYGLDFFEGQLKAVEGLVKAARHEAVIVLTLYSPYMCAGQVTGGKPFLDEHLRQDPDKVRPGIEAITDSMLGFVRECIRLGVDGFYTSTQGGEAGRFDDPRIFDQYIRPYDLTLMDEIAEKCEFTILHVCDYHLSYDDFSRFVDYPGDVVNSPLEVGGKHLTTKEAAQLFKRPFMGGLERKGVLATGTPEQVRQAAEAVLHDAPDKFIRARTAPYRVRHPGTISKRRLTPRIIIDRA